MSGWKRTLSIFTDRKMLVIFLLGISSGFPLALCFGTLTAWLQMSGIDKATIGIFSALTFPYAVKFLWSPIFDSLHVPYLTNILGKRRAWLIFTQIMLVFSVIALGMSDPTSDPYMTGVFALILAFFSASQDINVDAYRVEYLEKDEYGPGSATAVLGYRVGMLFAGAGAFFIAGAGISWNNVYIIMSAITIFGFAGTLLGKQVDIKKTAQENHIINSVILPFKDYMTRNGWLLFLVIIIMYKLPDAVLGSMANVFYLEIGFSLTEIAGVSKVFGFIATLLGSFLGGILATRLSLYGALFWGLVIQGLTVLIFSVQAIIGHSVPALILTIGLENIGGGISDICLVVFISNLCNKKFTASQFALLSSLSVIGRTFLRTPSGYVAESTGWLWFFVISAAMAIPAIIVLILAKKHIDAIGKKA